GVRIARVAPRQIAALRGEPHQEPLVYGVWVGSRPLVYGVWVGSRPLVVVKAISHQMSVISHQPSAPSKTVGVLRLSAYQRLGYDVAHGKILTSFHAVAGSYQLTSDG